MTDLTQKWMEKNIGKFVQTRVEYQELIKRIGAFLRETDIQISCLKAENKFLKDDIDSLRQFDLPYLYQKLYDLEHKGMEEHKMATLKEEAQQYVPPTRKNISELAEVDVSVDVLDGSGINSDGKEFKYKYVLVNDEEYRVPNPVLDQLKAQMAVNPNLRRFKVTRQGEGVKTTYTVVPLSDI